MGLHCHSFMMSSHALRRMAERDLDPEAINAAVSEDSIIKSNDDDKPFPSYLIPCTVKEISTNVVVAHDPATAVCVLITAYRPDPTLWLDGFEKKRP